MNAPEPSVVVVPCSGIGKPLGSVTREAAYDLCEDLRPGLTELVALSKLAVGDPETKERVQALPAITIDGCQHACASKLVKHCGGTVAREVSVIEVFRRHKELKPEGIAELNDAGKRLARVVAEEVVDTVDSLRRGTKGASHG